MIELLYYPSNASFAPHILLEELGIPYTPVSYTHLTLPTILRV